MTALRACPLALFIVVAGGIFAAGAPNAALLARAKARRDRGDHAGAAADLSALLAADPENADALYLRSNVRFLRKDYRGATEDLTRVIAVSPRSGRAYANRGQARAALGDAAGALSDLRKARELDPARGSRIDRAISRLEPRP
ncbi:MAG: tetratricopeptide repeat protein [Elusimicrobia bacterium]|nr:tetratricopeptide repeat protein [Elusimicrobiota bacterium]